MNVPPPCAAERSNERYASTGRVIDRPLGPKGYDPTDNVQGSECVFVSFRTIAISTAIRLILREIKRLARFAEAAAVR